MHGVSEASLLLEGKASPCVDSSPGPCLALPCLSSRDGSTACKLRNSLQASAGSGVSLAGTCALPEAVLSGGGVRVSIVAEEAFEAVVSVAVLARLLG